MATAPFGALLKIFFGVVLLTWGLFSNAQLRNVFIEKSCQFCRDALFLK